MRPDELTRQELLALFGEQQLLIVQLQKTLLRLQGELAARAVEVSTKEDE